jgi:protein-S-isoprenylcysteine O-methyltransferase Ste14
MFLVRWFLAFLALPFMVLAAVPSLLLRLSRGTDWAGGLPDPRCARFWIAALLGAAGLALATWTCSLFFRFGEGTAAPWDPPRRFVVRGPYRHARNPMISGVILVLCAEAILFGSLPIAVWLCLFVLANSLYIPLVEEKGLSRRFGADYESYRRNVPRWLPRLSAWEPENRAR